jgi:hypothetical protein
MSGDFQASLECRPVSESPRKYTVRLVRLAKGAGAE